MADSLERYRTAAGEFGKTVHAVGDDQWGNATPCTEWDVRALVNHLVSETKWLVPLFEGKTVAEVGDDLDGDLLGDDPKAAWDEAIAAALPVISESGAMERTVHLSFGDFPGAEYLDQMWFDLVVHNWDLAKGIDGDASIDPGVAQEALDWVQTVLELYKKAGAFSNPVQVPADADAPTRLIALTGRQPG